MMVWLLLLSLLLGGCAKPRAWYEEPLSDAARTRPPALYGINLTDGSHMPYPAECHLATPDLNRGILWHGYFFPNRAMRWRFSNQYFLSVCLTDELVFGCHPFGISGYDWPIPMGSCKESVAKEATP